MYISLATSANLQKRALRERRLGHFLPPSLAGWQPLSGGWLAGRQAGARRGRPGHPRGCLRLSLGGHRDDHAGGNVHSPSTSMAGSAQYRQLINDFGPPSLGYTQSVQGTGSSQVPQSKYAELLAIIEELGKEIRPTYAGSKSAMERLKRGIIHARGLVRECLAETERNARS